MVKITYMANTHPHGREQLLFNGKKIFSMGHFKNKKLINIKPEDSDLKLFKIDPSISLNEFHLNNGNILFTREPY